jgi:hypothetical protein
MRKIAVLIAAFSVMTTQVFAACYTPEQYRAEQAIRFHTQFMLIGMLCRNAFGEDSYASYQRFTDRNQGVIAAEENRLISYFAQNGDEAPDGALHTLRTNIANAYSMQAMKSQNFCRMMVNRYRAPSRFAPQSSAKSKVFVNGHSPLTHPHYHG